MKTMVGGETKGHENNPHEVEMILS